MNYLEWFFNGTYKKLNSNSSETSTDKHFAKVQSEVSSRYFERLSITSQGYFSTSKVPYKIDGTLKQETIIDVFDFAYDMTFGGKGQHRDHRSGGHHERTNGEIFANTFQGKIAECAACNFFYQFDKSVMPDFSLYELGKWDSVDISVLGKEVSVKSTKSFGQLLLLETSDWDENGIYKPNKENGIYDFIILVRLNPSCEDLLKKIKMFYSDSANADILKKAIFCEKWTYNYVGYLTRDDLKYIIANKYILPKKALLNGKTAMDAENYYVQAGSMRSMESLKEFFYDKPRG